MNQLQKIVLCFGLAFSAIGIIIQMILPFPYGLISALVLFVSLPAITKRFIIKYAEKKGGFSSLMPSKFEKICLRCGWKTKKDTCPRCESRQFRYT